ncbi:TraB/GumN family protein [Desulfallas thermosapovorans]|uniref:Pheromone shutdown-related protein TraB n=1 Tax=Desulfallas thermosapovorans DSM 6562 TaxID=1121431 RepID=A0A5S4ZNP5_9FIRM|nr:TraB/GumN family protein [Desulfallas thermosapovorans]TYO94446.1 pheromone shutdown-related protein TraB [Desulfallas thermosapovorans DSM 6562]
MATDGNNVHRLEIDGKEIILIGTAHVSPKSVDEVKEVIQSERPDTVCVELCQPRYQSITDTDRWKNTDIFKIIKEGKAMLLLINLILSSYQKRLAQQFGVQPGQEMIQGINSANEVGATLCLADREIHTTMLRLWRGVSFWGKVKLLFEIILSMFDTEEISEEEMEKMKGQDMLTAALSELSRVSPKFKSVLIDERDQYLAEKIKTAPGNKVVAVLGAGHVHGIKKELYREHDLAQLSQVAPTPIITKIIGWGIPLLIIAIIASTFSVDKSAGLDQLVSWVLWNGSLSALGALIALGHPLTVLTAFIAAPVTSLNPMLAAGWFAGITEAFIRKPNVRDFENISEDIFSFKGFWRNKVTRILLVVVLANIGSSLGTYIGGAEILRRFFHTFF